MSNEQSTQTPQNPQNDSGLAGPVNNAYINQSGSDIKTEIYKLSDEIKDGFSGKEISSAFQKFKSNYWEAFDNLKTNLKNGKYTNMFQNENDQKIGPIDNLANQKIEEHPVEIISEIQPGDENDKETLNYWLENEEDQFN